MIPRMIATVLLVAFAIGAFFGAGPTTVSPNPFGFFFLGLAVLVWFAWPSMTEGFNRPGIWDSITKGWLRQRDGDHHRKSPSST